ncbi:MAG: DUF4423 domain-containing protein [Bdellovibrionota bacterium]
MSEETQIIEPRLWLEAEYLSRRQKNPSYSLRAFSRLLSLPSGRVSQLLSKKRNFTPTLGKKIALKLNYDPLKTHQLLTSIEKTRGHKGENETYTSLDMDQFQSIADPIHFALLSLVETVGFKSDPKFIAAKLGISPLEARMASERLVRVGLLKASGRGKLELTHSPGLTTSHDVKSSALREAHKKVLAHAAEALESVDVDLRDVTSITMAIDPRRLVEAKAKLRAMRRELSEFLEGGRKTEVYRLNIQLVPVSKGGKKR